MASVTMATNEEELAATREVISHESESHCDINDRAVETINQALSIDTSISELDLKQRMDLTSFMVDQCAQMENSFKSNKSSEKHGSICCPEKQGIYCMIHKQLQIMRNLNENLKTVRKDHVQHMVNIREHLAGREQEITCYIDGIFCEEAEKVLSNIRRLSQYAQEVNDHKNSCALLEGKLKEIQVETDGIKGLSFKPLYSIDVGMVLHSNESVDYDLTCFRKWCEGNSDRVVIDRKRSSQTEYDIHTLVAKKLSQLAEREPQSDLSQDYDTSERTTAKVIASETAAAVGKIMKSHLNDPAPQLPVKSARLVSNFANGRRRKSLGRRGVGFMSIHRSRAECDPDSSKQKNEEAEQLAQDRRPSSPRNLDAAEKPAIPPRTDVQRKPIYFVDTRQQPVILDNPKTVEKEKKPTPKSRQGLNKMASPEKADMKMTKVENLGAIGEKNPSQPKNANPKERDKKAIVFVEMSEENAYAKTQCMEGYLEMLKNNRERKETQEQPCQYGMVNFSNDLNKTESSPQKEKQPSANNINPDIPQINGGKKDPNKQLRSTNKNQDSDEQELDASEPPLPPRLYRKDDSDWKDNGSSHTNGGRVENVDAKKVNGKSQPAQQKFPEEEGASGLSNMNVPARTGKEMEKVAKMNVITPLKVKTVLVNPNDQKPQPSTRITGLDKLETKEEIDRPPPIVARHITKDQKPVQKVPTQSPTPGTSLANMKELCKALPQDVLSSICLQATQEIKLRKDAEQPPLPIPPARRESLHGGMVVGAHAAATASSSSDNPQSTNSQPTTSTAMFDQRWRESQSSEDSFATIYDGVSNWVTVPFLWEQTDFQDITSAVFLSDGRIVILDGNWLRFLTRIGNMTARCELKQLSNSGPLRMSCSKADTVVVSSAVLKKILVVPTSGTRVKGSLYTVPDVMPQFASVVEPGYVVGGKVKIKGDWKNGVAVLDGKLGSKNKWQVKSKISEMATAFKNIFVCLEELHSVAVYNLQGSSLYSFGDRQTLFRPVSICVNLNGDVIVCNQTSEEERSYQLSSWSSGGSKQMDLLQWNKTISSPAITCHCNKLVIAAETTVACYQISF